MSGALIMAIVALVAGVGGVYTFARATRSEASVYRHRIIGTMALALSAILFLYAYALHSWDVAG